MHEALNLYYCYLLLKTSFPKEKLISFSQQLQGQLGQRLLDIRISSTHHAVYQGLLDSGIPALKEFNISNLMCDIYIPRYISSTLNI